MKSAAIFCLLLAVQAIYADPLSQLKTQVQIAKSSVNSVISDLHRTKNSVDFTTSTRISNKKTEFIGNINNFVNPALKDIRASVDAAKAQGKGAEHCFENAKSTLKTVSMSGFADLNKCEEKSQTVLDAAIDPLDIHIATGNKLLAELDGVFTQCISGNIIQMQTCAAIKLGTINSDVRNFESNANSAKMNASSAANNAVLQMQRCGFDVTSTTRAQVTDARLATNRCVESA